ncbi:MAG TPA: dihydropteroate synthase [Candidatus Eremiobacteraceae bacterium]|nr:dihydropteroate synthase [Candidatus Eremiobacteraceae bacterium]
MRKIRAFELDPMMIRGREFRWGTRTFVMGIINVTPDSFSGDGLGGDIDGAVQRARSFAAAGADIIDVGGESTRPGHEPVLEDEEAARVIPALAAIRAAVDLPISIDTFKPAIASAALAAGADMINCVWGAVPGIVDVAVRAAVPLVVMHNRNSTDYEGDCVDEIVESLGRSAEEARRAGVERIIIDPGIGFGKTGDQNVEVLGRLNEFVEHLPYPLLVGTSRKSFIGKITGLPVEERAFGTAASIALAIRAGADIVRIHDVEKLMATIDVADAICRVGSGRSVRPAAPDPSASATKKP